MSAGEIAPRAGVPEDINAGAALSAAVITTAGGRDTQFDEVTLLGDWDGREDFAAEHSGKVDDFSGKAPTGPTGPNNFTLTRVAISEHTIANGFGEDIFYYGDSFGNLYVASTTNVTLATPAPNVFAINLPTVLTAFTPDVLQTMARINERPILEAGNHARRRGLIHARDLHDVSARELNEVHLLEVDTAFIIAA